MDRTKELELFDRLCRDRALREWLEAQNATQISTLLAAPEHDKLLKAQGACAMLKSMLDRLVAAEKAAAKR